MSMKIESPVLRRLGPVPFWRGTKKCLPELDVVYRRAREAAVRAFAAESAAVRRPRRGKASGIMV